MRAFRWRSSAAGLSSHSRQSPTNSSPGRGRGAKVLVPWSPNSGRNRWKNQVYCVVLVAQAGPPSTSPWSGAPVRGEGRDCAQLRLFETHSTRHCTMQCTTHKIYTADRMRFSISYTRLITRLTKLTTRLNSQARLSLPHHHLLQLLRQQRFYLQTLDLNSLEMNISSFKQNARVCPPDLLQLSVRYEQLRQQTLTRWT